MGNRLRHLRLMPLALLLVAVSATAEYESKLRDAGSLGGIRLADSENPNVRKVYIVQLKSAPAADFHRSLNRAPAKPGAPRTRFDKSIPIIEQYAARLTAEQDRALARAGPGAELVYRYHYGLNGFAARMHPSQAHKLDSLPEVLHVWEDEVRS